jgi:DNA-binding transcriptional MocR family regulator
MPGGSPSAKLSPAICRQSFAPDAENVLIVNGAQHGLAVTVMGLLRPGDVVAVDALTYSGFKALAALYHLELAAIPCRADGPDLQALHVLCQQRRVRAVYTMPTLHNPLGWVLSARQRQALADLARQHDLLIIEDAAYASLIRHPPPPVASYAPESTVYITGFSKNVATGLRVGTVVCPSRYRPEIERAIRATTWNTPSLVSSLICAWIEDGTVARFEAQKRQDARRRQGLPARFSARFPSSAIRIRILSGCLWARRVGPIGWRKR